MSPSTTGAPGFPLEADVWRWGSALLWAVLAAGVGLTLLIAAMAPDLAVYLPAAFAAALVLTWLVQYPLFHLCVVLLCLLVVFDPDEGVDVLEAVVTAYYMGYLASWFAVRWARGERVLRDGVDSAVAGFLVLITAGLALTFVFDGSIFDALNEWRRVFALAFYFPLKEAAARDERALKVILIIVGILVFVIALRNLQRYNEALQNATALWRIILNRTRENERFLMLGFFGGLVFLLYYARTVPQRVALLALTVASLTGVVASLSRTLWVAALLGLGVMFLAVDRARKTRLALVTAVGGALAVAGASAFFSEYFGLIMQGVFDRFSSMETASQNDISLINRFYEWRAVWGMVTKNPIAGYGFGVPYGFFEIIVDVTEAKTFSHNTPLSLLYRHGILGFGLVAFAFAVSAARSALLVRERLSRLDFATALTALAMFPALALAAMTEDIVLPTDGAFGLGLLLAVVSSLWQRREREAALLRTTVELRPT